MIRPSSHTFSRFAPLFSISHPQTAFFSNMERKGAAVLYWLFLGALLGLSFRIDSGCERSC